jgi:hypothetical protein
MQLSVSFDIVVLPTLFFNKIYQCELSAGLGNVLSVHNEEQIH